MTRRIIYDTNRKVLAKAISAYFYQKPDGGKPVQAWLKSLPVEDRKAIGKNILKVEIRWPCGKPLCRSLGKGLWEVRSTLPSHIGTDLSLFYYKSNICRY